MPMFYTPKPRQFHYKPRFYDPEREDWELLKAKYDIDDDGIPHRIPTQPEPAQDANTEETTDQDLEYFQRRLRDIERKERQEKQKITLADLFRKRERPQFHYVSRFDENGNLKDSTATHSSSTVTKKRITRRFNDEDMDGLKPVPAGKIMLYTLLVCVLLYLIFA
ncbi:MAG: hypothetical protein J6031_04405 [Bacteroidales bacterium]|nr:hypothetical protein [Bacteroidales bacterium]